MEISAEASARDEAFWAEQEKRKKGALGQPCCTQSKMSWSMIDMPGNFAVVIHGEQDCLNCFHHHTGRSAASYYSTRLTDYQITSGETQRPLRHLLHLIVEHRKPDAVIVLGTCPVEVIGDRFEEPVRAISEETGVPMAALHTSGLKLTTLAAMQDWLYTSLASLAPGDAAPSDGAFNLIGMPEMNTETAEPIQLLEPMGLQLNGAYPHGASLDHWRAIGQASASFVVDASAFPKLSKQLEATGQKIEEIPLPVGPEQSAAFYRTIAAAMDREADMEAVLEPLLKEAGAAMAPTREKVDGMPLAMAIRMLNTYRADQLAYDGLGDYAFLRECGFDVSIFVQGPPEEGEKFAATLVDKYGIEAPIHVFAGPLALSDQMRERGFRLAYAPDSSTANLRQAGIAVVPTRIFPPFFSGVAQSVALLDRLVDEGRALEEGK